MTELPDPRGPSYRLPSPPPPDPTGWHELRRRALGTLWPPRNAAWAGILALAVSAAGLYGLWFQATLPGRLPSETDWKAAAGVIAREARPGDAVVLAPTWAERAREILPERIPARPELPLPVLALPSLGPEEDLRGIRRVWLLSLPGAPGGTGPAALQLTARAGTVEGPMRLGQLELTRFDLKVPFLPLWTLPDRLASASVEADGATVVAETREVRFLPRNCVVARWPGPGLEPVVIRLKAIPLGVGLTGRAALVGDSPAGGSATVRVQADGIEVARAEATPGRPDGESLAVDASRLPPGVHQLAVEIVPSGPLPRGVCVDLVALP